MTAILFPFPPSKGGLRGIRDDTNLPYPLYKRGGCHSEEPEATKNLVFRHLHEIASRHASLAASAHTLAMTANCFPLFQRGNEGDYFFGARGAPYNSGGALNEDNLAGPFLFHHRGGREDHHNR